MDEIYFREVGMGTVLVYLLRDRKVSTGLLLVHSQRDCKCVEKRETDKRQRNKSVEKRERKIFKKKEKEKFYIPRISFVKSRVLLVPEEKDKREKETERESVNS